MQTDKRYYDGCRAIARAAALDPYITVFQRDLNSFLIMKRGKGRRPVTMEPGEINKITTTLQSYLQLEVGWDGYDGQVPTQDSILAATAFLIKLIGKQLPLPNPMLSADGSVGFYWDRNGAYIDVGIESINVISYFAKTHSFTCGRDDVNITDALPDELVACIRAANTEGMLVPSATFINSGVDVT